jgi:hypothetical protein
LLGLRCAVPPFTGDRRRDGDGADKSSIDRFSPVRVG